MRVLIPGNREARIGLALLALIAAMAVLVPALSASHPDASVGLPLTEPSRAHLFGTDQLGRDVFVRTFAAARIDIILAALCVVIPLLIGTAVGSLAGMTRSAGVDALWMALVGSINALPFVVLAIAILAFLGTGPTSIVVALSMTNWARYARVTRAKAMSLRDAPFIEATRVLGYSRRRVLSRHVVPNVLGESIAYGMSDFVLVIVVVSGLSFIGLGVQPPTAEWGAMMADGRLFLQSHPWVTVSPGILLSLTAIAMSMYAQGVLRSARGED